MCIRDRFLYSGAGMEHWVEDVLKSLDNKELVTVEASGNLALRKEHTDEHAKEEQGHDHGGYDPHVWLNPMNAKKEMELSLIHIYPAGTRCQRDRGYPPGGMRQIK